MYTSYATPLKKFSHNHNPITNPIAELNQNPYIARHKSQASIDHSQVLSPTRLTGANQSVFKVNAEKNYFLWFIVIIILLLFLLLLFLGLGWRRQRLILWINSSVRIMDENRHRPKYHWAFQVLITVILNLSQLCQYWICFNALCLLLVLPREIRTQAVVNSQINPY